MLSFQHDRNHLLYLCKEIVERMSEATHNSFGHIGPLIRKINDLDLAQRFGFKTPPLSFDECHLPNDDIIHKLIWNDPHGTGCGEAWVSVKATRFNYDRIKYTSKVEDRNRLINVMQRWIRTVQNMPEPKIYPAPYPTINPKVDLHLWSDPLWRTLDMLASAIENDPQIFVNFTSTCETRFRATKIQRLLAETGLGQAVFGYREEHGNGRLLSRHLHVFHPNGPNTEPITLSILNGSDTSNITDSEILNIIAYIKAWQQGRAEQLEGAAINLSDSSNNDICRAAEPVAPASTSEPPQKTSVLAGPALLTNSGMPHQKVKILLEKYIKECGGEFTSKSQLAKIAGCSRPTVDKAIKKSLYLSARLAESKKFKGCIREVPLTDAVLESIPCSSDGEELDQLIAEQKRDAARNERQSMLAQRRQR